MLLGLIFSGVAFEFRLKVTEHAAVQGRQMFLLIGTLFLLPIVFMYTGWSYYVFRRKVRGDIEYH